VLELLLADIRDIFDASNHLDRIASATLIERLIDIDGRPWAEYGRNDKPITQNMLARLLDAPGVKIAPEQIRFTAEDCRKGYYRHRFDDAFQRLLSPKGASQPEQRNKSDEMGTSSTFETETGSQMFRFENGEKPNNDGQSFGVSVAKGGTGNESLSDDQIEGLVAWYEASAWGPDGRQLEPLNLIDTRLFERLSEMVPPGRIAAEARRVTERVHGPGASVYGLAPEPVAATPSKKRSTRRARPKIVGPAPADAVCVGCLKEHVATYEPVIMMRDDSVVGCKSEPQHVRCARIFFESLRSTEPKIEAP
jgi:hypothetical protein